MSKVVDGLNPKKVFHYFEEISNIPRGSGNEKEISDYLIEFAKSNKLNVIQDDALNIIIYKPATKNYKNALTVLLQGHMDMVCEKNESTIHDFENDPIKLIVDDDMISADGTTLGADNGIAIAMSLALLESSDIPHPALEVLITVDEEMGMTGAFKVDGNHFKSNILINLDSESDRVITVGCAGGGRISYTVPINKSISAYKTLYAISVKGLKGGHSGIDIHKERANANVILARVLNKIYEYSDLYSICGGSKDNAIPREAMAIVLIDDYRAVKELINEIALDIKNEFSTTDSGIEINLKTVDKSVDCSITKDDYKKIITSILLIPNGVIHKSTDIDLVLTSNNIGVIKTLDDSVLITCAPRSSVKSQIMDLISRIDLLADSNKCILKVSNLYPGWEYKSESLIRDITIQAYKDLTGREMLIEAIHAGLECGLLMEKIEGLDAMSIGPLMYDVHTPDERISISSVKKSFDLLCEVLGRIS